MTEVAGRLTTMAERCDARVVAVGGDDRAVGLLLDELPVRVADLVERIDVTRAPDGSVDRLADEVDRVRTAWVDQRLAETMAAYQRELGQHDRATTGPSDTIAALRNARVATLLVPSPRPSQPEDTDGAVVAALDTGADVQVVPEDRHQLQTLGAILRW